MSMSVGSGGGEDEVMVDINTTPLIDVMLVLIIMLIITIPIQTHAVKMDMPVNNPPPPTAPPIVINIDIDWDNTITWDGNIVTSGEQLRNYLSHAGKQDPKPEIHLRPDKLCKYDQVAKILATAQRLEVTNIGIVGNEAFD